MSAPRVLVTRSEPGAFETAARLTAAGYTPLVEPVFGIEPMAIALPEGLKGKVHMWRELAVGHPAAQDPAQAPTP